MLLCKGHTDFPNVAIVNDDLLFNQTQAVFTIIPRQESLVAVVEILGYPPNCHSYFLAIRTHFCPVVEQRLLKKQGPVTRDGM